MSHFQDGWLATRDGLDLRLRFSPPSASYRALVVLTHGHGEHCGRYLHVMRAMGEAGFAVIAYDLRGHGLSRGPRGHCPSFESFLDDLHRVHEEGARRFPGLPNFLFGHSLGGMITLGYALARDGGLRGAIVNAPALRMAFLPPAWKLVMARVFSRLLPRFSQKTGLADATLSNDTAFLSSLPDADLRHTDMSARLGMEMLTRGAKLIRGAPGFPCPILLTHGEADPVVALSGSRAFFGACGCADKTLFIAPGQLHETHNDLGRAEVIEKWVQWIANRVA